MTQALVSRAESELAPSGRDLHPAWSDAQVVESDVSSDLRGRIVKLDAAANDRELDSLATA